MALSFLNLLDIVTARGEEQTELGTKINISGNGTTTVAPHDLQTVLARRFAEMKGGEEPSTVAPPAVHETATGR